MAHRTHTAAERRSSNSSRLIIPACSPCRSPACSIRATVVANPANANNANAAVPPGTIVGWAHDWKPEPGKTYRYMVRYKIQSPVWATVNVTKPKTLADQFSILSGASAWNRSHYRAVGGDVLLCLQRAGFIVRAG